MPTYLIHGFRWPRPLIRIHIILQNIDDAAAEWLMAPETGRALIENFKTLHADTMKHLPDLRFIEQYDPMDESSDAKSQPFAYVADVVHEVHLGVEIDEIRGKGVSNEAWGAIVDLRDAIAPGEKVAWFVVVCGDTERWVPPTVKVLENSGAYYRGQQDQIMEAHGADDKKKSKFAKLFSRDKRGDKTIRKSQSKKDLNGRSAPSTSAGSIMPSQPPTYHPVKPPTSYSTQNGGNTPPLPTTQTTSQSPVRTVGTVSPQSPQRNGGAPPVVQSQSPIQKPIPAVSQAPPSAPSKVEPEAEIHPPSAPKPVLPIRTPPSETTADGPAPSTTKQAPAPAAPSTSMEQPSSQTNGNGNSLTRDHTDQPSTALAAARAATAAAQS